MTDLLRTVVYIVGAALLLSLAGIVAISLVTPDKPIPDTLQVTTASTITGLLALLVPREQGRRNARRAARGQGGYTNNQVAGAILIAAGLIGAAIFWPMHWALGALCVLVALGGLALMLHRPQP